MDIICEDCGKPLPTLPLVVTGEPVFCEACMENYGYCERCGRIVPSDTLNTLYEMDFCQECYEMFAVECVYCGEVIHQEDSYCTENGPICEACYEHYYFCCDGCDRILENDEYGEDGYCHACVDDVEHISGINGYGYKPTPKFKTSPKDRKKEPMYFGIELEVKGDALVEGVKVMLPWMYGKSDSSINGGFEIVSHPTTYEGWLDEKENVGKMLSSLATLGFKSHNTSTCGIHIHITKKNVSTLQLYKMLHFTYQNPDFILGISQREKTNLNAWAKIDDSPQDSKKKARNKFNFGRYEAWNLSNDETIECRIFRGNLRLDRFYKNIEFVQALISWARVVSLKNISLESFCNYVFLHRKEYSNLWSFMGEKFLCV